MQKQGFTKALTIMLALACIAQGVWILGHYPFPPELSRVVQRYPLEGGGSVYVIESDPGEATVPLTYRYYLSATLNSDDEVLEAARKNDDAFLVTRDADATVVIENRRLKIAVRDAVYAFTSLVFHYSGGEFFMLDVWLDARPENLSYVPRRDCDV